MIPQATRNSGQHLISLIVASCIVKDFEVVQIHDKEHAAMPSTQSNHLTTQFPTVQKSSQWVMG
jgi:hypothetical protein